MTEVTEYKLSFCTASHRDDDIAIIEINDGVEVNADMAREITELADRVLDGPIGLLSNRKNSYSLSFEAMNALVKFPKMAALAIVINSPKSRILVEIQNSILLRIKKKPIKIFEQFEPAVDWLHTQLEEHSKKNHGPSP